MTPYLVVNHFVTQMLRKIPQFVLNLGMNALDDKSKFKAYDNIVGHHVQNGGGILHRIGDMGSIAVYVDEALPRWCVMICVDKYKGLCRRCQQHEFQDPATLLEDMLGDLFPEKKAPTK